MPHLSPMKWTLMTLFFTMFLMMFLSSMWWKQLPHFSSPYKEKKSKKKSWMWNY